MATVQKRGNSYLIRVSCGYDVFGKQIIRSMTWKPDKQYTEKQLKRELDKQTALFEESVLNGKASADGNMRLADFIPQYLENVKEEMTPNTMTAYKRVIDCFIIPALGHLKLKEIKPMHIQKFVNLLATGDYRQDGKEGEKYAPSTVRRYYVVLQSIMHNAYSLELIPSNPADGKKIKLPSIGEQKTQIYTPDELAEMLECLKDETLMFQILIHLAINTGCRRGELVALQWSDINFDTGVINISKSAYCAKGQPIGIKDTKTGKSRKVAIPQYCIDMLIKYKAEQNERKAILGTAWEGDDWIFIQDLGGIMYPTTPTLTFTKFLKRHNLPHKKFHALRHTSATLALINGINIKSVAARLGHSQLKTTDRYVHAIEETEILASQTLGNYITSLTTKNT